MGKGALVLVVGPSGAGKDSLINGARVALAGEVRFSFPRRVVTRTAVAALEDHDSLERAEFARWKLAGAFALDWDAHGLSYGIPVRIEAEIASGGVVVVNTSRRVIERALDKYADCHVIVVSAAPEVRAQRLSGRGRESSEEIAARLVREGAPVPDGVDPIVIDNSGRLEDGIDRFIAVLRRIGGN